MAMYNCFLLLLFVLSNLAYGDGNLQLRMANVLYRHGDRSPVYIGFPNDPHKAFWQRGPGQLTEKGMEQEFDMGQFQKTRYSGKLLNSTYLGKQVYCRSSDKDRTLQSAEAQMAGLYPPKYQVALPTDKDYQFWQLIPIHTVPVKMDSLLVPYNGDCPKYNRLLDESYNSSEFKAVEEENKDFLYNVSIGVGLKVALPLKDISKINDMFVCQRAHNLSLPSWTTTEVLNKLEELAAYTMEWIYHTHEEQRLSGGPLLGQMISNMQGFINKTGTSKKLFVYSAHDLTLVALLNTLGLYNGIIPPYSTLFMMELYQNTTTQEYFVRMFYRNQTKLDVPYELSLPNCQPCSLKAFINVTTDDIPEDYQAECNGSSEKKDCGCLESDTCKGLLAALAVVIVFVIIVLVAVLVRRYQLKGKHNRNQYHPVNTFVVNTFDAAGQ